MKQIEIIVQPDCQTRIETKGFSGPECRQASEFIEKALGKRIGERLTGEFYQSQSTQQTLKEGS